MSLISAFISHQIWLQRNATSEVNEMRPLIEQMRQEVKQAVLAFGDESRTKAKLTKMLKDLTETLYALGNDWDEKLVADLQELAKYEAKWTAETMEDSTGVNFTTPTPEQVWSAVKFNPLALDGKPVDFAKLMAGWEETEVARLVQGVKSGFVQGQTTRQIVRSVVGPGGLGDVSERHAATVVRTALNHVSTQARLMTLEKNSDIVEKYEWVSTLDSRTSTICRARDGQKYEFGKGPLPPAHPNCLLGDTVVSTCSRVSNVFKRTYKGVVVYLTTKAGRTLSVTPNHPILTTIGWVPAGELNLGSQLVCSDDRAVSVHHKENNVVAEFADLFGAVHVAVNPAAVSTSPTTTEDFHGDGTNGEVEIIPVNGLAWDEVKTGLDKQVSHQMLPVAGRIDDSFVGLSSSDKLGMVGLSPSNSFVRGSGEREALLRGSFSHSDKHSVTSTADSDAVFTKDPYNWATRNADNLSDFDWSEAVGVEFDDVVSLVFGEADFCGHVYNLENEQNWYLANGIIAHNCRSTISPVVSSEFDFLDAGAKRAARGADGGMQVSADMSYYDFLKQQPAWFQNEALGPVRGAIFRNAGMTPEEFRVASVDGFGRPLTLKEMAETDKRVRDYLKGE